MDTDEVDIVKTNSNKGIKKQYMNRHQSAINKILEGIDPKYLFPCVKDIISGRIESKSSPAFSRQDVTQYLASWFKYIGVSKEGCQEWMIEYAIQVLSKISSSSHSRIKHSTKSNLKYIYKSDVSFDCGCENNIFKASCNQNCPIYKEMSDKYKERKIQRSRQTYDIKPISNNYELEQYSLKDKYKEQFEKALETAIKYVEKGISKKEIVKSLNNQDFKTRTGKKWTYPTFMRELKMFKSKLKE